MKIRFSIPYRTVFGQRLALCGSAPALGEWALAAAPEMRYDEASTCWSVDLDLPETTGTLTYKYLVLNDQTGAQDWEAGVNRTLDLNAAAAETLHVHDFWRPLAKPENELLTNAFTQGLFRRPAKEAVSLKLVADSPVVQAVGSKLMADSTKKTSARKKVSSQQPAADSTEEANSHRLTANSLTFKALIPRVPPHLGLCILGSDPALGGWDNTKALVLSDRDYPTWQASVTLTNPADTCTYKYALWDAAAGHALTMEGGENRVIPAHAQAPGVCLVRHDDDYQHPDAWRGAGVALPVFALRSEKGLGVGEFSDLNLLVDWAVQTGMKLVQILPINDTVATHTWIDSYPYAAISVFALHPQFLHLEGIAKLKDKKAAAELAATKAALNALDFVDYEPVMAAKFRFLRLLYQQEKKAFLADADYRAFHASQAGWLVPYAAFSAWRDRFGTADFNAWPADCRIPADLPARTAETAPDYDDYGLFFFLQFHLDKQLRAAVAYARSRGVVLKGDLPIGIYRHSVEAWTQPELFHLDAQAGAPPDDFSTTGQNWRFPTYNWERMALDGYGWWKQRMGHLSRYFDALRIDHILGFFRIWEIPTHSVQGLLGHFAPALPLHRHEIEARLGWFDYERLCQPYIRWHMLESRFQEKAQEVFDEFLYDASYGRIHFREGLATQREVEARIALKTSQHPEAHTYYAWLQKGLFELLNEVLFVPAGNDFYHPRITLTKTQSYRELASDDERRRLGEDIYVDFFFRRHEDFWRRQGLVKLPPVRYATNMLICGEDLGMVPASVPGVMRELGMLGLHIQRMPSNPATEFGHPDAAPYLSVVTTSSHDMSTLRGWWEADRVTTQRFFETMLGHARQIAPFYCEPWVAREILVQHLHSPAMWAVFPLQDLLAIDGGLRRADPHAEQINVPSNPEHFWKYRLHLPLEELVEAVGFNEPLRGMVAASGRG